MDTTSYLNPVKLCAQFNHVIWNLEEEKNAYENLKKDMEEKILNENTLQGETAESLKAYAADYILILGLLIMANEDDKADAEKMIRELNTEDSPLVETTAVLDGFQILTMLQDAKGKEDMYNRLADEYARAAEECGALEGILKEAYRGAAEEYRRKAEDEHKKVEMCQARVDRYDRIEADTKECFKRSGEPRSLANAALDAMPCSFLNGEYKMDISASWRLDIKVYQYTRERDLFALRQYSSTNYNKAINSSYEKIFPEYALYLKYTNYVNAIEIVGEWYTSNIDTYCCLTQAEYNNLVEGQRQQGISSGDAGWISTTARGRKGYSCTLYGNLNGLKVYDDCSSFVTACLIQSGFLEKDTEVYNSYGYIGGEYIINGQVKPEGDAAQALRDAGFVWYPVSGMTEEEKNNLQLGDIMVKQGHVQIFDSYKIEDDALVIYAYSWGRIYKSEPTKTCESNTFIQSYEGIWRLEN